MDNLSPSSPSSPLSFVNDNKKVLMSVDKGVKSGDEGIKISGDSVDNGDSGDASTSQASQFLINKNLRKQARNEIPDFSLCNPYQDAYHPISEENKPHYKYGTILRLVSEFNLSKANFCEVELYNRAIAGQQAERKFEANPNIEIFDAILPERVFLIADKFGLSPSGEKLRQCPFHNDNNPSLSLDEARGLFHCFGCKTSGNIIKFYAMLKKLNPKFTMKECAK
jgi:hypothetical protein